MSCMAGFLFPSSSSLKASIGVEMAPAVAVVPATVCHRDRPFAVGRLCAGRGVSGGVSRRISSVRCFSALTPGLKATLDKVVTSQKIILFMKGTKDFPQCGFSHTVVQILTSLNIPFETINILENEMLRQGLKEYSQWPTFPQLYIDGEFFGGCDITVDAYKSGELQELLDKALCS